MSAIGIVIVTYNSQAQIGGCLDAALATGAELVVVDNASVDGTIAEIARRGVRLIANSYNRGFAGAVNQGFAVLNTTYVLLLNPDTVIQSSLEPLREACDLPGAAAAGGCLLDADGHPQIGFMVRNLPTPAAMALEALLLNRLWPNNQVNRWYRGLGLDYSARQTVGQPAGAFLMVRRQVWQELGGFDERFFPLWFEDVDFCRRATDRGYRLYYVPQAIAKHTGAHSMVSLTVEKRRLYWYGSFLRYSAKHFHRSAYRGVCLAVITGSFLRMIFESALHRSLKPIAVYGKVVRLTSRWLFRGGGDGVMQSGLKA
ncbi:MAG TPA: glycosyltransferase family 2 protein [Bryobacteraceae bacterium]|nr:glycosyltransferase family 2 protein [Bryobacteraceae bacterium]